ncbi:MAG: LysR family transcriptional regulator [Campylobacterales bacterium]|nr:LysR family transcriptional regulator [Campylobacterales bacterium]
MLRDFTKIETFLAVVKEKSFSKASKKLGISQPAVTQQIKLLEEYMEAAIVDRKKNGIKLTKEGEELYRIAQKLEKHILSAEKELLRVIGKQLTFVIGASFTIGNYILPDFIGNIKDIINNDVMIKVDDSTVILEKLLEKKVDVALIEHPLQEDGVAFREWIEDELVLISKSPLPKLVKKEELYSYDWICREEESLTRKIITEAFHGIGVDCQNFNLKSIVTTSTAAKQMVLKSSNQGVPTVSIVSRHIVEHEVENGQLHLARVKGLKLTRPLFLAHLKERKNDPFIDNVCTYIMGKKGLKAF